MQTLSEALLRRLWIKAQQLREATSDPAEPVDPSVAASFKVMTGFPGPLICHFWQRSGCSNGDECGYLHLPEPSVAAHVQGRRTTGMATANMPRAGSSSGGHDDRTGAVYVGSRHVKRTRGASAAAS